MDPLVTPSELESLPGAPFSGDLVDIAAASVRAEAGWHIAPVVTETITVQSWGAHDLPIPSLRVVSITAVRSGATSLTYTLDAPGILYRPAGWPVGPIEIDLTHGFAETPRELMPVVAARVLSLSSPRDPSVASRTVGQVAESYRSSTLDPTVARYRVTPAGIA